MKALIRIPNTSLFVSQNTHNHHLLLFDRGLNSDITKYDKYAYDKVGTVAMMLFSHGDFSHHSIDLVKIEKVLSKLVRSYEGKNAHWILYVDSLMDMEKLKSSIALLDRFNYFSITGDLIGPRFINSSIQLGQNYKINIEDSVVEYNSKGYLKVTGGDMDHSFSPRHFASIKMAIISLDPNNLGQLIFETGIRKGRDFRMGINYYQEVGNRLQRFNYKPFEFDPEQRFEFCIFPFKHAVMDGSNGQTDNAIGDSFADPIFDNKLTPVSNIHLTDGEKAKISIQENELRLRLVGTPRPDEVLTDSVAFIPEGRIFVHHPDESKDKIKILLGTSGTETLEMDNNSSIEFSISNLAFLYPEVKVPTNRLSSSEENKNLRTSWIKIKGTDKVYNNQPQESPFYGNNVNQNIYPHYQNTFYYLNHLFQDLMKGIGGWAYSKNPNVGVSSSILFECCTFSSARATVNQAYIPHGLGKS